MAGFYVKPDSVASYGKLVQDHEGYADRAYGYGAQEAHVDESEGLVAQIWGAHYEAQGQVCDSLRRLGLICRDSGMNLTKAAEFYRTTDSATAGRLDNTYPGQDSRPLIADPPARGVGEYTNPTGRLIPPVAPAEFTDPLEILNMISDFLSPGKWIQEVLDSVIGVNPVEELVKLVAGDWESVAKASNAFHCLSYFCSDMSRNIGANMDRVRQDWQGHAASAADGYFKGIASTLDSYRQGCERLRDEYLDVAKGISELTRTGVGLITDIFDKAFWVALKVAAGAVLSETVIGPAVLWSLAALDCAAIVEAWGKISNGFKYAQYLAETFKGGVATITADDSYFKKIPLPAAGYQHPAVG